MIARGARVRAVVVASPHSPYIRHTLKALASQTRAADEVVIASLDEQPGATKAAAHSQWEDLIDEAGLGSNTLVVSVPRATTFGGAIRRALRSIDSHEEPDQRWMWLLHDDSAPEADALDHLLGAVEASNAIAIAGVKQVGWDDPDTLISVGTASTKWGRRYTGIEEAEIDQGQHDGNDDVLSLGTAGMLIASALWRELGGPDPALGPFEDGRDLCERARLAGHRVVVVPKAKVRHARASYRGLRGIEDERPENQRPDSRKSFRARREAQLRLRLTRCAPLANPIHAVLAVLMSLVRAVWRVAAKELGLAAQELIAPWAVLRRPRLLWRARRKDRATRKLPLRSLHSLQASRSQVARGRRDRRMQAAAARKAKRTPSELEIAERNNLAKRRRLTFTGVLVISAALSAIMIAPRAFAGALIGGALLPADTSFAGLWHAATSNWIATADGFGGPPDPFLLVLTLLSALSGGALGVSLQTTIALLLTAAMPLAAITAWFGAGAATRSLLLRAWAALVWAIGPALMMALGIGQLGVIVAHILLPLLFLGVVRSLGLDRIDVVVSGMVGAKRVGPRRSQRTSRTRRQDRRAKLAALAAEAEKEEAQKEEAGKSGERSSVSAPEDDDAASAASSNSSTSPASVPSSNSPTSPASPEAPAAGSREAVSAASASSPEATSAPSASSPESSSVASAEAVASSASAPSTASPAEPAAPSAASPAETAAASSAEPAAKSSRSSRGHHPKRRRDAVPLDWGGLEPLRSNTEPAAAALDVDEEAESATVLSRVSRAPSLAAAAGAGLVLTAASMAAPVLLPVAIVALLLVAVFLGRRKNLPAGRSRLLLVVLLPAVALLPLILHAISTEEGWRVFASLPGRPVAMDAAPAWAQLLGWPVAAAADSPLRDLLDGYVAAASTAAVALVALLALLRGSGRSRAVRLGWLVALVGLVAAQASIRIPVAVAAGSNGTSQVVNGSAAPAVSLTLAGLLMAALVGLDGLRSVVSHANFGWRQMLVVAATAFIAVTVTFSGVAVVGQSFNDSHSHNPSVFQLSSRTDAPVPALGLELQNSPQQSRVLMLTADKAGVVHAQLWRGNGPQLSETSSVIEVDRWAKRTGVTDAEDPAGQSLTQLVADLASGGGNDLAKILAAHAISVVVVPPVDSAVTLVGDVDPSRRSTMIATLDAVPGLNRVTENSAGVIWRVSAHEGSADSAIARIQVRDGDGGLIQNVPSSSANLGGEISAKGKDRQVVMADRADGTWRAWLDGESLRSLENGWRQTFEIPDGASGELVIAHRPMWLTPWRVAGAVIGLLTLLIALPTRRRREEHV